MVHCVEVELFPNVKNPVIVPGELAREFVEWANWYKRQAFCSSGLHICDRLAARFEKQLKVSEGNHACNK